MSWVKVVGGGGVCTCARALTNPSPYLRNDCTDCAEIWFSVRGAYSHKPGMYVSPANTRNYCTCMPHLNVHPHIGTSWRLMVAGWRFAVEGLRGWRFARLAVCAVGGLRGWRFARLAVCVVSD